MSFIYISPAVLTTIICTCALAQSYYVNDNTDKKPSSSNYKKGSTEGQCGCMHGPPGAPGIPGVPGYHGQRGGDGGKGDKGDIGATGLDGRPGLNGLKGPVGPSGSRGKRGEKGTKGEYGMPGPIGMMGDRGLPGLNGLQGIKGNKGDIPTLPKKVAFSVARSLKLGPVLLDSAVTFDKVFTNIGNSFDEFNSHFVCKVNGTYIFTSHVMGLVHQDADAWIMVNNKHTVPLRADGRAGYGTGSQTIIINLRYDDHVWIQLSKGSGVLNDYTTFTGYLLYEDDTVSTEREEISNHLETNNYSDYWRWRK